MLLLAKQRIRFRGVNGPRRAAAFAQELDGRCTVFGNEIFLEEDIEIGPRLFNPRTIPFKTAASFNGHIDARRPA